MQPALQSTPRAAAGIARLEFALAVAVAGVIAAFALHHIAQLQISARGAELETKAAQSRTLAALAQARGTEAAAPASPPCPITPTQATRSGALPGVDAPISCQSTPTHLFQGAPP